jgi:hypothetical protein
MEVIDLDPICAVSMRRLNLSYRLIQANLELMQSWTLSRKKTLNRKFWGFSRQSVSMQSSSCTRGAEVSPDDNELELL